MKLNEDTVISDLRTSVVLVPYVEKHVARYHTWMQDPKLLELTASEPLTLEEEHENMKSWQEDPSKLTFILIDSSISPNYIIGDVNLYLLKDDEMGCAAAELEVMIAEQKSRRKGLAKRALLMMLAFAYTHLNIKMFVAKILMSNMPSIDLFVKKLDFVEFRRVNAFNEIHFQRSVDDSLLQVIDDVKSSWRLQSFKDSIYNTTTIDNDDV